MNRSNRLKSFSLSTGLRCLLGCILLLAGGHAAAVSVSFDKATNNSSMDYSSLIGADLTEDPTRTLLNLHNGAADQGRITNVYIEDSTGALTLPPVTGTLILESFGPNKVSVIKAVRGLTGLGLKEAKDLVESAPVEILISNPIGEVQAAQQTLNDAGATTSLNVIELGPLIELDSLLRNDVVLESFGSNKVSVIKAVRGLTGLGLKESKDLVESAPVTIESPGKTPEEIREALETAGGTVSNDEIKVGLEILTEGISVPRDIDAGTATVTLESFGPNKVSVIKAVRGLTGLGLKEAKDLVESAPVEIDAPGKTPAEIKEALENSGATVSLTGQLSPPAMDPDYQLLLDYKGEDGNPDLLFLLGMDIDFETLLALLDTGAFRLGLEFTDDLGSDLYLAGASLPDVSEVPVPPMVLPMALSLMLIGWYQRKFQK